MRLQVRLHCHGRRRWFHLLLLQQFLRFHLFLLGAGTVNCGLHAALGPSTLLALTNRPVPAFCRRTSTLKLLAHIAQSSAAQPLALLRRASSARRRGCVAAFARAVRVITPARAGHTLESSYALVHARDPIDASIVIVIVIVIVIATATATAIS